MEERLKLAEGRPLERVLMAAMAQLDCGSCGYLCETYAEAIAGGEETDLNKCVPGGRETAKKLRELMAQGAEVNRDGQDRQDRQETTDRSFTGSSSCSSCPSLLSSSPIVPTEKHDRKNPYPAAILQVERLNRPGSEKDVRHVEIDLKGSGLTYEVGDSLGVYPENCPELVEGVLAALGASGDDPVTLRDGETVPARQALATACVLNQCSHRVLCLLAQWATDPAEARQLQALVEDDPDDFLEGQDLLDLLELFPSARGSIGELAPALSPLQPRLYSIASSLKVHPDQVHLTVGVVRYAKDGCPRPRKGVASTFLAERVRPGVTVKVFVQPSHGFRLPPGGDTPVILVGPGTGIAPFRAFLQERRAVGARGRNWLFFGDQRRDCDFLYQEELEAYLRSGLLTRLDLAFSRDQREKIYVQHRMLENAAQLWAWLEEGASFYVCGDARRMARDVDATLHRIVAEQGGRSEEAAKAYVAEMKRAKRYQRDVY
jgi:sulfite reductase (NADPH) flavoprotein alpha-component